MFSPLLYILVYGGGVMAGILTVCLWKVHFTSKVQKQIKGYHRDIVKSHARILELEAEKKQLSQLIRDVENTLTRSHMFMN
jgi:hypothetical protein